ncbi:hypothetical protein EPLEJJEB_00582 [Mannheimia haemolytica]
MVKNVVHEEILHNRAELQQAVEKKKNFVQNVITQ